MTEPLMPAAQALLRRLLDAPNQPQLRYYIAAIQAEARATAEAVAPRTLLHPDDGHDHWFTCVRCGVDNGLNDEAAPPTEPDRYAAKIDRWRVDDPAAAAAFNERHATPAAGKALLKRLLIVLPDLTPEFLALIERDLLLIQAEARGTAEAEIAELRTLVGELSAGCLRGIECSNPVHIRAARLLAAPPTEPTDET